MRGSRVALAQCNRRTRRVVKAHRPTAKKEVIINYENLFSFSNLLTIPFWLLMILVPTWTWTRRIIGSTWILVPAALLYAVLVLPGVGAIFGDLANPQLQTIRTLLGTPQGATIGWVHFLAFDLFVGRWAYLDSRERNLNPVLTSVSLFFVLMLGPFGLLLYLALRGLGLSVKMGAR
jgi:hypothetical protein